MPDDLASRTMILARIQTVAADILNDPSLFLTENTTAADVSGWDSLSHVQIVVGVEIAFGMRMTSTEVAQLENVGSMIDLVEAHQAKTAGA